ncbi:MAG TPA: DUF5668 domain-containing protein [Syntrophorhabdaceae bacterium]|nr:DUF5668 domain-containing protein [Syntrophorhabdaceae bacterium]
MRSRRGLGAYILIILGGIFLLYNFGLLPHPLFAQWWPLILIFVGVLSLMRRASRNDRKDEERKE